MSLVDVGRLTARQLLVVESLAPEPAALAAAKATLEVAYQEAQEMHRVWADFNAAYFQGALEPPIILFARPGNPTAVSDCRLIVGGNSEFTQIRIHPDLRHGAHPHLREGDEFSAGRKRFIEDLLLHEMAHQYQNEIKRAPETAYRGHGPVFAASCRRIGALLGLGPVRPAGPHNRLDKLPSCTRWPSCVRPADYYQGALAPEDGGLMNESKKLHLLLASLLALTGWWLSDDSVTDGPMLGGIGQIVFQIWSSYFRHVFRPTVKVGEQTGEIPVQTADEGRGITEIYGAAPEVAIEPLVWLNATDVTVGSDNRLTKTGGTVGGARSERTIPANQNFAVSWNLGTSPGEGRAFGGLVPASESDFLDGDKYPFGILVSETSHNGHPAHGIFVYELGTLKFHTVSLVYKPGETVAIVREGNVVRYYHRGRVLYTSTATSSAELRFAAYLVVDGKTFDDPQLAVGELDTDGGCKTTCTVIWAAKPRKEVTASTAGFFAPRIEKTQYFTDLMLLVGRGPLRLKKVFYGGDMILNLDDIVTGGVDDLTDGGEIGVEDPNADPPRGYIGRLVREIWGGLTVRERGGSILRWYPGNYEQLPDPLIQADVGVDSAPAYRGKACLMIENLNISKYGGVPAVLVIAEHARITNAGQIAVDLCERAGLEPQDYDFREIGG